MRLALGASRQRIVRLLLVNSLLLAGVGAVGAIGVAALISRLVRRVLLPNMDWTPGVIDRHVFVFSLALTIGIGVLLGVLPAWRLGRVDGASALKSGARDAGRSGALLRSALMMTQAAMAMLLLVGAGLFVRSLENVRAADLGVQPERVVLLSPRWLPLPPQTPDSVRAREQQRREQFARTVIDRLSATPEVDRAAATINLPFGSSGSIPLAVPGWDSLPKLKGTDDAYPSISAVSSNYFAVVGTRLFQGRIFANADRDGSELVDRRRDDGGDAVAPAERDRPVHPRRWIVATVRACRRRRAGRTAQQDSRRSVDALLRSARAGDRNVWRGDHRSPERRRERRDPQALRAALRQLDPRIRFVDATVLQDVVEPQTRTWRLGALLFSLFAGLAVVVAGVGMFGVVAYLVEQRRYEIGVRLALGARGGDVVRLDAPWFNRRDGDRRRDRHCRRVGRQSIAGAVAVRDERARSARDRGRRRDAAGGGDDRRRVPALRAGRIDPVLALRVD